MIIKTYRRYKVVSFVYFLLVLLLLSDLVAITFLNGSWGGENMMFSPFLVLILFLLFHLGRPMLEYDSEGEVIVVKSREPLLEWMGAPFYQHYEFPKDKLIGYKIKKFLFRKTIQLEIDSKKRGKVILKTPVSYLGRGEIKELEQSLKNAVKHKYKSQAEYES